MPAIPSDAQDVRILVVDDESAIRSGLTTVLETVGYSVIAVESGEEALAYLQEHPVDLALLDIRMSGMSGVALMEEIKRRWPQIGVILLTGYATLESAVAAVRAGADDYLMKPSRAETIRHSVARALDRRLRERRRDALLAQLRDGLRQLDDGVAPSPIGPGPALRAADILVDPLGHEARRGDQVLDLTPTEFDLLVYFLRNPERAISHQELVREVQGYDCEVWEARELIKYHIYALRQKLEPEPSNPRYIQTVRGVGYKLSPSAGRVR